MKYHRHADKKHITLQLHMKSSKICDGLSVPTNEVPRHVPDECYSALGLCRHSASHFSLKSVSFFDHHKHIICANCSTKPTASFHCIAEKACAPRAPTQANKAGRCLQLRNVPGNTATPTPPTQHNPSTIEVHSPNLSHVKFS
jgi:hypothetical protein